MWVEGRYHDAMNEHEEAIKTYQSLYSFFPDNLEYGLQLASAQTPAGQGQDPLGTIDSLRTKVGMNCLSCQASAVSLQKTSTDC